MLCHIHGIEECLGAGSKCKNAFLMVYKKKNQFVRGWDRNIRPFAIPFCHKLASLVMLIGYPRDGFFPFHIHL